jgi:hypothetical protein
VRVELHPDAHTELRDAAFWYDERRRGLGTDFITEVFRVVTRIGEAPASFPQWPRIAIRATQIRQAVIRRFPYLIAFEVYEEFIVVLAIAHSKRRPLYWLNRSH